MIAWLGSAADWVGAHASIVISLCALGFTIASFYVLNLRHGRLRVGNPQAFEVAIRGKPPITIIRLPLILYNTGATPILVQDLRLVFIGKPNLHPFRLTATLPHLTALDEREDEAVEPPERRIASQFLIDGRKAVAQVFEFWGEAGEITLLEARRYDLALDARWDNREKWRPLAKFPLRVSQEAIDKFRLKEFYPFRNEEGHEL
jgi:hypothetical protein